MPSSDLSERGHALLVLDAEGAEWREHAAGSLRTARAARGASTEGTSGCASAALAARSLAGGVQRRVVVVLGEPYVHTRVFILPELTPGERERVLERKAASLAGAPLDDLVHAVHRGLVHAVHGAGERTPPAGKRWLVAAARHSELARLVRELEHGGLRVARIVPARLAALPREFWDGDSDVTRLGVQWDGRGAALWLSARGGPLHVGALARGSAGDSARLAAILQEVRSCIAYARRTLRGAELGAIALDGFEPEDAARLEQALAQASNGASVTRATRDELAARRDAGARSAQLAAFDLRPVRSRTNARTTALVAGALALTIGLAAVVHVHIGDARSQLATERRGLEAQRSPRADTPSATVLRERLARCETRIAELEQARTNAREFTARVATLARTFGDDAALLALEGGADGALTVDGAVDTRPLVALSALERVTRRAASAPGLGRARVELGGPRSAGELRGAQRFTLSWESAP